MLGLLISVMMLTMISLYIEWFVGQLFLILYGFIMVILMFYMEDYVCIGGVLGGDLMSGLLILLSFWLGGLMIMSSQKIYMGSDEDKGFMFLILMMMLTLYLSFGFIDLFWFYIFFELVLIPTLLMIVGWGVQPERLQAGVYMLFYTLGASLPLLTGLMSIYVDWGSLIFYVCWYKVEVGGWWVLFMLMAFLVKLPMFMVHLWLPSAHVEAPVAGSMILAGVLLKLGGYGMYRVMMMIYSSIYLYMVWVIGLCLIGGVIISFICLSQVDLKALIAYSSVSHMGLLLGGYGTFNSVGLEGGMLMMIAHGLCSSGLFCLVNVLYEKLHTRSVLMMKGMMLVFPSLGLFWFLMSIGNMAAPPTINLLGEVMLMISMMGWSVKVMLLLGLLSFMSAGYSIYMYSSVQHGKSWVVYGVGDVSIREFLVLFCHLAPLNYLIVGGEMLGGWY